MLKLGGHVAHMEQKTSAYEVLVGTPEGKRQILRSEHRCEDDIKMYLRTIGCEDLDWINLAQDRVKWSALLNKKLNFRVH